MKFHTATIASCVLALSGTTAMADCAADLAQLAAGGASASQGISKDGSLAPLEDADAAGGGNSASDADSAAGSSSDATSDTAGAEDGIAKDGSLAPLEEPEAGGDTAVAMSGQDAAAQQSGEQTAAEDAQTGAASGTDAAAAAGGTTAGAGADRKSALIVAAQAALDAGSEEACSAVVQLIREQ